MIQDDSLPYARKPRPSAHTHQAHRAIASERLGYAGWAVLEAAAIYLNATIVPEQQGDPLVKHQDAGGYSHKAVLQFDAADGTPREPAYLHEGLLQRHKVDPVERYPLSSWTADNDSIEPAPVRIVIQGIGERTVIPSVFCPDTQEGVVFNGFVPDSKTLVIDGCRGGNPRRQPG